MGVATGTTDDGKEGMELNGGRCSGRERRGRVDNDRNDRGQWRERRNEGSRGRGRRRREGERREGEVTRREKVEKWGGLKEVGETKREEQCVLAL